MLCRRPTGAAINHPMNANPILAYGRWLAEAPAEWPQAAIEAAHRAFIDIVGVTVRGALDEAPRRVLAAVKDWGEGVSSAIGLDSGLSPPFAPSGTLRGRPSTVRPDSLRSSSDHGIWGLLKPTARP